MARNYLVTGGAGFIGSNYVARLLQRGEQVTIFDNLSRGGRAVEPGMAARNLWRKVIPAGGGRCARCQSHPGCRQDADVIVHLAAQVAVTTSVTKPREDFEINALGTFNVLEAARASGRNPACCMPRPIKSTAGWKMCAVVEPGTALYLWQTCPPAVPETQPLDFHSPYGCSKGCGDQYVRDYHRIYGLPTVVLRQSCIYGPRQFGVEDQGWVAWFVIAAVTGRPISIYGDGKQVRDMLFVEDLLDAYDAGPEQDRSVAGQVFNVGGGPEKTLAVWTEFGPMLEKLVGHPDPGRAWRLAPWRPEGFISDIRKAEPESGLEAEGWRPGRHPAAV